MIERSTARCRVALGGVLVAILLTAAPGPGVRAALLALRPGPIDRPLHFVAADFNRDGRADLLIANFQAGALTMLLGYGDGTFAPHPDSPFPVGLAGAGFPSAGPLFVAVADFNPNDVDGDGVANGFDNCPNVFNPAVLGAQADTNGNGVGNECEVGVKDIDGNIIGPIDTDGDGVPDFDPVTLALDNCPLLPNPGQEDTDTAAGPDDMCGTADDRADLFGPDGACGGGDDLTGDGVGDACSVSPDLVVVETTFGGSIDEGILRLRVNTGTGGMAARTSKITGRGPSEALLGDFDADGRLDLVVSISGAGRVTFFAGLPDGEFGGERSLAAGEGPQGMAAADFDLDGRLDLAVGNRTAGTVALYLNDGTSLPDAATATFDTPPQPTVLLAGLLDGDACHDLVVLHQADGGTCAGGAADGLPCASNADCPDDDPDDGVTPVCRAVSPTTGLVTVRTNPAAVAAPACDPPQTLTLSLGAGQRPRSGVLADLDGDGRLDLAIGDFTGGGTGGVRIFSGNGDGTFTAAQSFAAPVLGARNPAALAALDYDGDARPDLGVLGFANNRLDLLHNDGGLSFSVDPESPVSRFKETSFVAITAADASPGNDLVLVQRTPPALAPLSGIGNTFFRPLKEIPLQTPQSAWRGLIGDIREDNRLDLLIVDRAGSGVTVINGGLGGTLTEADTVPVGPDPIAAALGNLYTDPDDFDRDGVPNVMDNCPARYNPPGCTVDHPDCFVEILCTDTGSPNFTPVDCGLVDPVTGQCDSDGNGVGDHCQVLSSLCSLLDNDGDTVADYDPATLVLDNCPFFPNLTQADANGDGVGDACERGVCEATTGGLTCVGGPIPGRTCVTDADCGPGVTDIVTVSPGSGAADGSLTLLIGDGSGSFRQAAVSPVGGLGQPAAALIGPFSLDCGFSPLPPGIVCLPRGQSDLLVAERHVVGDPADDTLTVLQGDGTGGFTPFVTAATQGDPETLLLAPDQPVCTDPSTSTDKFPAVRFRSGHISAVVAVLQPETSSIGVYLPGGRGVCSGGSNDGGECLRLLLQDDCPGGACSIIPVLEPPPARSDPLPIPGGRPSDALFVDLNRDGVQDIVAVARDDGDPSTPGVVVYMGIGNGLFYTDPTLNPPGLDGDYTLVAAAKVTLTPGIFPDVILFDERDGAPVTLTNVLRERADIDGSGRVDGVDLAILARAFGAYRGEDFTLLGPSDGALDGTLLQTGSGVNRFVVGSGVETVGQDLTRVGGCDQFLEPVSPFYSLAVDIDLDGDVDGVDLAILASLFGTRL